MTKQIFTLAFAVVLLAACQQKKNARQDLRAGRGLRGSVTMTTDKVTVQQCGSYSVQGKQWGEVTSQSQTSFTQSLVQLTAPVLSTLAADDQLGFVSAVSSQPTGVRFWGNVKTINGAVDASTAEIRVEIYDDRACQTKADGTVRPNVPIHIGHGLQDFVSATGQVSGTTANLVFSDKYGSMILSGTNTNGWYTGTMSYTLASTGGSQVSLGTFRVPYCYFFVCQ